MHARAARPDCGFYLVELLLVLAVLALAAAFAIPAFNGTMASYRLRASADLIAGELDAARVMAISRGAVYEVRFDADGVQVVDPQDSVANAPRTKKFLEPGITVVSSQTIQFQPRGSCSGTGMNPIRIQNEAHIQASVAVNRTGKIAVSLSTSTE